MINLVFIIYGHLISDEHSYVADYGVIWFLELIDDEPCLLKWCFAVTMLCFSFGLINNKSEMIVSDANLFSWL
jgi:hypothetical protein